MFRTLLYKQRRKKLLANTAHPSMRRYLSTALIDTKQEVNQAEYLAVDLEMTGLNAETDSILSVGYVPIINAQIDLSHAVHRLLKNDDVDLSNTAPIHNIRNIDLQDANESEAVMDELLQAMTGRVLVFHHAGLDLSFLNKLCKKIYQVELQAIVIDTMQIELRRLRFQQKSEQPKVRLHDCRKRYNLPHYSAHNATIDAIATAELWLAQISHITADEPTPLNYFL